LKPTISPSFTPTIDMLVQEIFQSIQGESTYAGLPCTFIRLTGCNLRCHWCDTQYAYTGGEEFNTADIVTRVADYPHRLIEITGGEPLLQTETPEVCQSLLDKGYTVLVETNGTLDIGFLPAGVIRIMDIKCPGSGYERATLWDNIMRLTVNDQIKFVVADRNDFDYTMNVVLQYQLDKICPVLISPVIGKQNLSQLAQWILQSRLPLRLQIQMHKILGIK
jgi:7-carboxy-7-deazaguanine synthase